MTEYDIHLNNKQKLTEWIEQQPNLIKIKKDNNDKIYCVFNHTPAEEIAFKQEIANRLFSIDIGNNTFENTLPNLEALQTDALIYITELSTTKTNVGTTFTDLFTDYGGRNFFIDLTSYNKVRYHVNANIPAGSGTHNLRIVDNATLTNVLLDVVITDGQNNGNVIIPPEFEKFRGRVRIQVKSTQATDDPRYDRIMLHVLRPNRN